VVDNDGTKEQNHAADQRACSGRVFDPAQKRRMIEDLTEAMAAIEGENMRPVTWVVVDEVASGGWASPASP
jgi:4-oxalocrotonate tautomerase